MNRKAIFFVIVAVIAVTYGIICATNSRFTYSVEAKGNIQLLQTKCSLELYNPSSVTGSTSGSGYKTENGTSYFAVQSIPTDYTNINYKINNKVGGEINQKDIQYYIRVVAEDGSSNMPIEYNVHAYNNASSKYSLVSGWGYGPFTLQKDTEYSGTNGLFSIEANYTKLENTIPKTIYKMKVQLVTKLYSGSLNVLSEAPLFMKVTDETVPTISSFTAGRIPTSSISATVSATDIGSGIKNYSFYLNGTLKSTQTSSNYTYTGLDIGSDYKLKVVVTDNVGNTTEKETTVSGIKVGDTINYTPPTNRSYTVKAANSGYTSDQTFNSSNSAMNTWKVWKIDKTNNTIEILSTTSTATLLYLSGATGYNQGPGIMNNICSALYSNSDKGITARSLDGLDIEEVMAENWGIARGTNAFSAKIKSYDVAYGSIFTPNTKNAPNCYTTDDIRNQQNNDLRPETSTAVGYSAKSGLIAKYTYYNNSNMSLFIGSTKLSIIGNRNCWLASRAIGVYGEGNGIVHVAFVMRFFSNGQWGNDGGLFDSRGNHIQTRNNFLSPLVSFGSYVQLVKNSSGIWLVQ